MKEFSRFKITSTLGVLLVLLLFLASCVSPAPKNYRKKKRRKRKNCGCWAYVPLQPVQTYAWNDKKRA